MIIVRYALMATSFWAIFQLINAQEITKEYVLSDSETKQIIKELQAKWSDQQQSIKTAEFTIKSHTSGQNSLKNVSAEEVRKIIQKNSKTDSPDIAFRQIILDLCSTYTEKVPEDKHLYGEIKVVQEGKNVRNTYINQDIELMIKDDIAFQVTTPDLKDQSSNQVGKQQIITYNRADFKFATYSVNTFWGNHLRHLFEEKEQKFVFSKKDNTFFIKTNIEDYTYLAEVDSITSLFYYNQLTEKSDVIEQDFGLLFTTFADGISLPRIVITTKFKNNTLNFFQIHLLADIVINKHLNENAFVLTKAEDAYLWDSRKNPTVPDYVQFKGTIENIENFLKSDGQEFLKQEKQWNKNRIAIIIIADVILIGLLVYSWKKKRR
ncbi:MAG: hypothetical protein LBJ67_07240 [Planctomycetaceae bacterium]|jgi:hypothetical protein|nr:hypothetical protein [Planctomycetaceae bacterium]